MQLINSIFGYPLGYIMWAIYKLIPNYAVAILIFTILTKLALLPVSIKQQKSTAMMQQFQPKIQALQKKYANNKEKLNEETMKLYQEEGVNPASSCLPLLITFPVLFGVIDVVYRPLTHIMHLSTSAINSVETIAYNILIQSGNYASNASFTSLENFQKVWQKQLYIIQAYNMDPSQFAGYAEFEQLANFDMHLFGMQAFDLGANPTLTWPTLLIPIIAGLAQLAFTVYTQWYQKKKNPDMPSMGAMNLMLYAMPVMSVWFAFSLPMGVGYYWIIQSVIAFVQQIYLNKIYTPEKVAELLAKDSAKRKKKGKSYLTRMLEKQQALLDEQNAQIQKNEESRKARKYEIERDEDGNAVMSKSVQKTVESKLIADARQRVADKYSDESDE